MSRKELWNDRPAERYDTKSREVWIDLDNSNRLVVGLRVDALIHDRSDDARPVQGKKAETAHVGAPSKPASSSAISR